MRVKPWTVKILCKCFITRSWYKFVVSSQNQFWQHCSRRRQSAFNTEFLITRNSVVSRQSPMFAPQEKKCSVLHWMWDTQDSCWGSPSPLSRSSGSEPLGGLWSPAGTEALGPRTPPRPRKMDRTGHASSGSIWQSIWWKCKQFIFIRLVNNLWKKQTLLSFPWSLFLLAC